MPGDDEGGGFKAGERWFDFSRVTPPWPGFEKLGDNPEVCRPQMEDGADKAFGYEREKQSTAPATEGFPAMLFAHLEPVAAVS